MDESESARMYSASFEYLFADCWNKLACGDEAKLWGGAQDLLPLTTLRLGAPVASI